MYPLLLLVFLSVLIPPCASSQTTAERWRLPTVVPWVTEQYYMPRYLDDRKMVVYGMPSSSDDIMCVEADGGIRSVTRHVVDYRHLVSEDGIYALFTDGTVCHVDDVTQAVRQIGRIPVGAELLGVDEASRIVICRKYPMLYLVYDDGQSRMKEVRLKEPYGDDQIVLMDAGSTVLHVQGFKEYYDTIAPRVVRYDVESGLVTSDVAVPTATLMQVVSKRTMYVGDSTYMDLTDGTFFTRSRMPMYPVVMDTIHAGVMYSSLMDTLVVSLSVDTARGPAAIYRLPVERQYQEIYPRGGYFHVVVGDRYWTMDVAGKTIVDSGRNEVPFTFEQSPFAVSRDGATGLYVEYSRERGDKLFVVDRIRRRVLDSIPGVFMPRSKAFHVEGDSIVAWYETAAVRLGRRTLRNDRVVRTFGRNNLRFYSYLGDGRSLCMVDSTGTLAIVPAGDAPIHCPPLTTFLNGGVRLDRPVMLDPEGGQLHLTARGYLNVDISTQTTSTHRSNRVLLSTMYKANWRFQVVGTGGDTLAAVCPGCTDPYGSQVKIIMPDRIDSVDLGEPVGDLRVWDNRTPRAIVLTSVSGAQRTRVIDAIANRIYYGPVLRDMMAVRACEDGSGIVIEYASGDSLMLYDFRGDVVLWKGRRLFDTQYTAPDASAIVIARRLRDTVRVSRYPHEGEPVRIGVPVVIPGVDRYTISGFADAIVHYSNDSIHRVDLATGSSTSHRMELPFPNQEIPAFSTDRHGSTAFFMHGGSVGQGVGKYESYIGALNFSDGRGYLIPAFYNAGSPQAVEASPEPIFQDRYIESAMLGENGKIMGCYPSYVMAQLENRNLLCGGWIGLPDAGMSEYSVDTLSWSGQEYPTRLLDVVDYGGVPVAITRNGAAVIGTVTAPLKADYYYKASHDAEGLYLGTEYLGSSPSLGYVFARRGDSVLCYRTRDGGIVYGCPYAAFGTVKQWIDDRSVVIVRNTDVRLLDLDLDAMNVAEDSRSEDDIRGPVMSERAFDVLGREVGIEARGPKIIVRVDASGRGSVRKVY